MEEEIERLKKKIEELEKKLELYYSLLYVENELSFVMKGSYLTQDDIDNILNGNY